MLVIFLRKYYLFEIRNEFYNVYKKNPYVLYKTLENLHNLKNENLYYGITLFKQICENINKYEINLKLNQYIKINKDRYLVNEFAEESIIEVKNTYIFYNTNLNLPNSLSNIYDKNRHIFIVDFKNEDYFWLEEHIMLNNKYTVI